MTFRVIVQPTAQQEMEHAYLWLAARSLVQAARWLYGLEEARRDRRPGVGTLGAWCTNPVRI